MRVTDDVRRQIVDLLPRLRRFARGLAGDGERGDDLVQETCLRALTRLDQWEQGTRLDSWLYRIAQNIWFDRARALRVRGEVVDIDTTLHLSGEDGRKVTENRLVLDEVFRAMELLPDEQRVVIMLVCVEGLSYIEAAEIVEAPIGTVMSRLARGRRALYAATHGEPTDAASHTGEKARGRAI